MGYTTLKGGKIVIWTNKVFEADPYPFDDEGENHTYFFANLKGPHFGECLSIESEDVKKEYVSKIIGIPVDKILLRSRKSHFKKKAKQ